MFWPQGREGRRRIPALKELSVWGRTDVVSVKILNFRQATLDSLNRKGFQTGY